jgi:hypothetical protein
LRNRILFWLLPAASLCFAIFLGLPGAIYAPDAGQYRLLALGQRGAVPAPFSARILGPAIAGWLGRSTGLGADKGFMLLGIVCLAALLALVAVLLWSWKAPAAVLAAIFLMPFWVDIFHDYYLPDLLHAAILAAILLCLLFGHVGSAMLLLFPAYLARESTVLVAICLVFACWRRIRLRFAVIGVLALLCAGLVSRHYGQSGPASVHGLSGVTYILGKLFWSFFKNVLGVPLWSNTLPECTPVWVTAIPPGYHLGAIRAIGLCQPALWGPSRLILAWFGKRRVIVFRFCIVYGLISILMTPVLGASADRLVEYGWPFYFVVLPWFLSASYDLRGLRPAGFVALHLLTCWLAWFAFRYPPSYLFAGLGVLALNGLSYALIYFRTRRRLGYTPA